MKSSNEGRSSQAYAFSALLLPFVRQMIDGPTPLHVIDARSGPGSGKGLMADAIAKIFTGKTAKVMAAGRDDDEWRKRITAQLLEGSPLINIDNISKTLDSAALSAVLTAEIWEDRLLGRSEIVRTPVECVWTATGNNVETSREMARRMVKIIIDAKVERPYLRKPENFKHPDLLGWIEENRGAVDPQLFDHNSGLD